MRKTWKFSIIILLAVLTVSISFLAGCVIGSATQSQRAGLELIQQAWTAIYQNYVDPGKLDSTSLSRAAIKGIITALNDPYSAYLDPETHRLFQSDLQGKFEGIGAEVGFDKDNRPIVIAPLKDSPAMKAGIKSGDVILAVDGNSTEGLSLIQVVLKVRGQEGTRVKLTILHEGESQPVEIEIVRAKITSASVSPELKGDILYIHIFQFGQRTNDELNAALESVDLTKTSGIIIDLRGNPGGLVQAVVDVASHFIKEGVVISLVDNKGDRTSIAVRPNGVFTELPMVVLVDQYSASGSEVLSGALLDYKRATIAGVKTFGKGSYDIDIPLKDGSDIYLTVGRWLTPNGNLIEGKGIEPQYTLTETGDAGTQWAIDFLKKTK